MKRYISSGRLDNISNWRSREDQRLVDEANAKQSKIGQMISQVRALRPRIQEILETANAASEAGIPLGGSRGFYSEGTDPDYFEAEGIYHRVGVYPDWRLGGGPRSNGRNHYTYMGIENGGANGKYNFITDGDLVCGRYEEKPYNNVSDYPDFEYDLNKFLKGFDDFESRFYKYIDDLTGTEEI